MKIRKAVIPVAGYGTRCLPASKAIPKEMLPIFDRPAIQYIVEEAVASGIEQVIMITGKGKYVIEDHFDAHYELEDILARKNKNEMLAQVRGAGNIANIVSVRQKQLLGLGHAVLCAKDVVGCEPFVVLLGDDLIDAEVPCVRQMLKVFEDVGESVVAVERVPLEDTHRYGIIDGRDLGNGVFNVRRMVEKPRPGEAPSNLAIVGRYVLLPDIFDILETTPMGHGGEIQLTDALAQLCERRGVYGYEFEGRRYDVGDKFGFLQANLAYGMKDPQINSRLKDYVRTLIA
ncbi:MAG: UTP--glucose-1-phosphate uridylyltransferase GalU [Pseudomonadota bacterium]